MHVILTMAIICIFGQYVHGSNILFYQLLGSKSHKISMWPLAKELAIRGHNVSFITSNDPFESVKNLKEIRPNLGLVMSEKTFHANSFMDRANKDLLCASVIFNFALSANSMCEEFLQQPESKAILNPTANGNATFDLIIIDPALNDCILGAAFEHKCPVLYFHTTGYYPWAAPVISNPSNIPYHAAYTVPYVDNTKFVHRLIGYLDNIFWYIYRYYYHVPMLDALFKKYYSSDIPKLEELEKYVRFTLLNTHVAVDNPFPMMPNVVQVGCLHCTPAEDIADKKIKKFLDDSGEEGFIYFSLGSFVDPSDVSTPCQDKLIDTFRRLKLRVLWKWDIQSIVGNVPSTVMITNWAPQNDVLGHKNIRCFVSHGGKLSTEETLFHGVPTVVMSMIVDQFLHGHLAELRGYGRDFDTGDLLETDKLYEAITDVLNNKSYKETALKYSSILRDQINDPLERAVYWTEYVIRHKGAPHLQSPTRDFSLIQYHLIDVYFFIISIVGITLAIVFWILKMLLSIFRIKKYKSE